MSEKKCLFFSIEFLAFFVLLLSASLFSMKQQEPDLEEFFIVKDLEKKLKIMQKDRLYLFGFYDYGTMREFELRGLFACLKIKKYKKELTQIEKMINEVSNREDQKEFEKIRKKLIAIEDVIERNYLYTKIEIKKVKEYKKNRIQSPGDELFCDNFEKAFMCSSMFRKQWFKYLRKK